MLRCGGCVSAIELNHLDPPRLDGFANPILNLSWPPAAHRICGDCRQLFLFAGGPWVAASTRHSLRPLHFGGRFAQQLGRNSRRENANSYSLCCLTFKSEGRRRPGQARRQRVSACGATTRRSGSGVTPRCRSGSAAHLAGRRRASFDLLAGGIHAGECRPLFASAMKLSHGAQP
jgi:hypothetical protein